MDEVHRPYHSAAQLFPLLQGDEFESLKQDIAINGLLEPIWLHPDGSIIDGRNRHRACIECGIAPTFRTWDGEGSLVSFVVSLNLHRRHLNPGQRGIIGVEVKEMLGQEIAAALPEKGRKAAQNYLYGPETNGEGFIQLDKTLPIEDQRNSQAETAAIMNVGSGTMARAEQVMKHAPELAEKVVAGEITLTKAYREVKHQQKQDAPPLPTDKYRVWYADPPWQYGNSGVINEETDNYGRAARHYPTMSIADLCAMGAEIRDRCTDDAVLFLWVTSPLLAECFDVINAWGFKYKTSFVWDKVGHNFGHYNSVRHEFLLVCTHGSCTPDSSKLFDSVVEVQKSAKHSEKPDEFRTIIDTLYTQGKRIELFARAEAEGWDTWGNE